MLQHALDLLYTASLNVFGVVEEIRQAIALLYVELHVALDDAVAFHVLGEKAQLVLVAKDAAAIGYGQRPDVTRAISPLRPDLNESLLFVRQHALDGPLARVQFRLENEDLHSLAVHRRHGFLFDQRPEHH